MRTLFSSTWTQGHVSLAGDEAHHAIRVLRVRPGETLRLADGAGHAAVARVVAVDRDRLQLDCDPPVILPLDRCQALTVAVAPPKGDRWTDLVRGLTELGVGTIMPLLCERGERMPASLDRARRVAVEALKQCRRSHLPHLTDPTPIAALAAAGQPVILCDPSGGPPRPGAIRPMVLAIGPEGGFTDAERASLLAAGATSVRVAGPVLRIETAALAAAAVWAAAWEHAPA
jgi:16S rRNA (uracil1498-N3)-methyltransferase